MAEGMPIYQEDKIQILVKERNASLVKETVGGYLTFRYVKYTLTETTLDA